MIHQEEAPASTAAAPAPRAPLVARLPLPWLNFMEIARNMFRMRYDKSSGRVRFAAAVFAALYCVIAGKLVLLGLRPDTQQNARSASPLSVSTPRPDIVDRNGEVLATDVRTVSVFAEPRRLIDKDEAVELLTAVLPDLDAKELRAQIGARKNFVWVKRAISPKQQQEVHRLGLPGVGFLPDIKRIYPNGPIGAHVLGFANRDNVGIAGIEKFIDGQGIGDLHGAGLQVDSADLKPVQLSLDMRATHAMRDELVMGMHHFRAKAAAGAMLDVNTGEVLALVSLPDYDPNNPVDAQEPDHINRMSVGTYEMGSTFKAISIAMALESGKVTLNSHVDARQNLRYGRFTIHDFHAQHRVLSVPEVFTHSSNIGTARMAMMVGVEGHKAFLTKMGQLTRLVTELPENAAPIVPKNWGELNTITIAFGQGLNVAPLQSLMAVGALTNGGYLIKPTFIKRSEAEAKQDAPRVVRPEVSESLRYLMRLNAVEGSAKLANIPGYYVGGKTGTADKIIHGHYSKDRVFTTFMAVMPADKPRYLFLTLYDEPQATEESKGFHTSAWNAGITAGRLIERIGPLVGLAPRIDLPTQPFPMLARLGIAMPQAGSPAHR
jgi:cell division protein FtsI (penicillin-binding protein 3)